MPTLAEIRTVPKVLLHDHLDGGLRPNTVLELARETGYHDLPADNEDELTQRLTRVLAKRLQATRVRLITASSLPAALP